MTQNRSIWTKQDDQRVCEVILDYLASGKTQEKAIRALRNELHKTRQQIANRWYNVLKQTKEQEIKNAEKKRADYINKHGHPDKNRWTNEIDEQITSTILHYIESGKTQKQAYTDLAHTLSRTHTAIRDRWHNRLRLKHKEQVAIAKAKGETRTYVKKLETKIQTHEKEIEKLNALIRAHKAKNAEHI